MIDWIEDWDVARKRAQETDKPIFLFLFSPA